MSRRNYVVRLKMDDVVKTDLWSSESPFNLGYGLPYRLIQKDKRVYIQHKEGKIWEIKTDQIESKAPVQIPNFKESLKNDLYLRIESMPEEKPYDETARVSNSGDEFEVILKSGKWLHDSKNIAKGYLARYRNEKIFRITPKKDGFVLKAYSAHVYLNGTEISSERTISRSEMKNSKITYKNMEWGFRAHKMHNLSTIRKNEKDILEENKEFGAALLFTGLFCALSVIYFLVFGTLHVAKEKKIDESQFAKIVLPKKIEKKREQVKIIKELPKKLAEKPKKKPIQPLQENAPKAPKKPVRAAEAPKPKEIKNANTLQTPTAKSKPRKVKKKPVSKAVLKAAKLKNSMKGLLGGNKSILLSKSNKVIGLGAGKPSGRLPGVKDKSKLSAAPITQVHNTQDVNVDYSDGGESGGSSGVSYRSGFKGKAKLATGTSFVSVGAGENAGKLQGAGLTKKEVWSVINKNITQVRKCYEEAILRLPNAEGKLVVGFSISASGRVVKAGVASTTINDKPIGKCIVNRVKKWRFPKPKGSKKVDVQYPFIFRRL